MIIITRKSLLLNRAGLCFGLDPNNWYPTWSAVYISHGKVLFSICYRAVVRYQWEFCRVMLHLLLLTHGVQEKINLFIFFIMFTCLLAVNHWWSTPVDLSEMEEVKKEEAALEIKLVSSESQFPTSQLIKMTFIVNWSNGIWWAAGECWFYAMQRPPEKERLQRCRVNHTQQLTRYRGYAMHTEAAKTINQK